MSNPTSPRKAADLSSPRSNGSAKSPRGKAKVVEEHEEKHDQDHDDKHYEDKHDQESESDAEAEESVPTLTAKSAMDLKQKFLARRDIEFDVPDEVWLQERRCLLMLLEARMLLRELVEYKVKMMRIASGNLTITEIQNLLALYSDSDEDGDFISEIQELKRQLVKAVRGNYALEQDLEKLDSRIALLIQNRTSIQEIDRQLKKKKSQEEAKSYSPSLDFSTNKKLMDGYANLFYALQIEPKYLAKIAYVIPGDKTDQFIELLLLTLYGDANSPREEYLILQLFKYSMEYEIAHSKDVLALIQSDAVVNKMVLTYNKRKQGVEYIKAMLTSFVKDVMVKDYQFELNPLTIYKKMLNDSDVKEGKSKGKATKEVTADEAKADANVKAVIAQRSKDLEDVCKTVLDRVFDNMKSMPYGLRLICKQIRQLILAKFPKAKPDDVWTIIGYFVYYRFICLAIASPDVFGITDNNLNSTTRRKNLVVISKVILQLMYRLNGFPANDELAPLNAWISANRKRGLDYYHDLIDVPPPEDILNVTQYNELTQRTKPMIIISLAEIVLAHTLVKDSIGNISADKNDPLHIIVDDLGPVPDIDPAMGKKEIQLTLENRFKGTMEDEVKPGAHMYAETKELIIQIFKVIPIQPAGPQTLTGILKEATKYAKETNNKVLAKNVDKVQKNLDKLEELNLVAKKDKYITLLKDVAIEVSHRQERREAQQKEIARLKAALKNLQKHQEFMNNQITEFNAYLESCRKNSLARSKVKNKPVKFTYKELAKRKVILEASVSDIILNSMKFFISMPSAGTFEIEAKAAGTSMATQHLELETLLEMKENHINSLEVDPITLSVPETIFLINKTFLS